ncbi:MAG: hypothetical protein BWK73_04610 [Thiothrix lacustris]|uniref:Uncharacterized protein n=1 Tax=Thiothrix lacustris TaxID=525917 RepID=A0A1Y1QXG6_9GAMM|nr:MAG: hypothetical protein BWK73_04610 [Thiothrix lacustris]
METFEEQTAITKKPAAPLTPTGKFTVRAVDGFGDRFKAGRKFTDVPVELEVAEFTERQWADLMADKKLIISAVVD